MRYGLLADMVVFFHLLYVLFTLGGEILILTGGIFHLRWIRNMKFRLIHLSASCLVAVEALVGMVCPITELEYRLRELAGQVVERDISFLGRLIRRFIFYDFSPLFFILLYVGFASLVILSWFLIPPRRKIGF
ncbi:MAG: DUF2784 domain-containing protein [Spirochaetales bacterium]|nr:DUF2784 domain-containing protein [Spirochaetales bacterium]